LEIVSVDLENNVILVKGNVPGPKKSLVLIKTSVKNGEKVNKAHELVTYVEEVVEEAAPETVEEVAEVAEVEAPVEEAKEENVGE